MGNSLQSFNFTPNKITRVITDDTCNPWIVAKDVAANLDYNNTSKVGMIFKHAPDEWKGVNPIYTLGGKQDN